MTQEAKVEEFRYYELNGIDRAYAKLSKPMLAFVKHRMCQILIEKIVLNFL